MTSKTKLRNLFLGYPVNHPHRVLNQSLPPYSTLNVSNNPQPPASLHKLASLYAHSPHNSRNMEGKRKNYTENSQSIDRQAVIIRYGHPQPSKRSYSYGSSPQNMHKERYYLFSKEEERE